MARKSTGPRWYKSRKAYYATMGGVTQCLGTDLAEANRRYAAAILAAGRSPETATMGAIIDAFLTHVEKTKARGTFRVWRGYLRSFPTDLCYTSFLRLHVSGWLTAHPTWGIAARHIATKALRAAIRWAVAEGLVTEDRSRGIVTPAAAGRSLESVATVAQYQEMLAHAQPAMRDALTFLWETGCRPGAMRTATADELRGDRLILLPKEGRKLKRPFAIYLTPAALAVVRHGEGLLFRNPTGRIWNSMRFSHCMRSLADACGFNRITPYSFRHAFAYRAIAAGIPIVDIATLMATSVSLVERVYGHPADQESRLRASLAVLASASAVSYGSAHEASTHRQGSGGPTKG